MTTWQENPFVSENHFFQVSDEQQSRILECLLSNRDSAPQTPVNALQVFDA